MTNIGIDNCPTEVICTIFTYLDKKALAICMLVSKKWKIIAEHTVQSLKLWEDMVQKEMINKGITFVNKSTLDNRSIFKNSILWYHVKVADVEHLKTYEKMGVKKMNVYRDNLILVVNSHVIYYDIKTFELVKYFERSCLDFEENDHSIVELIQERDNLPRLRVYRKPKGRDFDLDRAMGNIVKDVKFYRLENELCYVFTHKNILWRLINKVTRWEMEFVGRYYGTDHDPITLIHMYNDLIYMVTKFGRVWYAETQSVRFLKIHKLHIPENISQYNWLMFDTFSCAVPVTESKTRVVMNYDQKADVIVLECSGLTCTLQHGDVLILGYNDGTVEIRIPKKITSRIVIENEPEYQFNIQQFLKDDTEFSIMSLNVCEIENAHILFVRTRTCVYQLQLSYPECIF